MAYPVFFLGGGGSTNSVEDRGQRERGSGGVAAYSGVLEAAVIWYNKFHFIYNIFLMFGTLRLFMMTINLLVIANVKQLQT